MTHTVLRRYLGVGKRCQDVSSQPLRAVVVESGRELAESVHVADSLFSRMKGLLGRKSLNHGEALWIIPCKGIHTIGMRFAIDAVFLDINSRIVAVMADLPPNRMSRIYPRAASVIELQAGTVAATPLALGETVVIS